MAIRALALNIAPQQVAALYRVSPRSLNNWIRRFNQQGIDALIERPRTGRPPKITPEQSAHYRQGYDLLLKLSFDSIELLKLGQDLFLI